MDITNIKIFRARQNGPVLAYANVILDNQFIIRGITLIDKDGRRFVSMPARKLRNGKFRDISHPLNSEVREKLTKTIFQAYEEFLQAEK